MKRFHDTLAQFALAQDVRSVRSKTLSIMSGTQCTTGLSFLSAWHLFAHLARGTRNCSKLSYPLMTLNAFMHAFPSKFHSRSQLPRQPICQRRFWRPKCETCSGVWVAIKRQRSANPNFSTSQFARNARQELFPSHLHSGIAFWEKCSTERP